MEKKLGFSGTNASVILDAIRGLAALQVFTRHTRNMFFLDFPMVQTHRMLLAAISFKRAGPAGGHYFFRAQRILIGGSVVRAVEHGTFHWGRYLSRRLTRLWVVLLPALLLTALWDNIGIASGRAPGLYTGASGISLMTTTNIESLLTFKTFFQTLFFLQGIHGDHYGSNGALWTLSLEFWYYILFIALCMAISKKTRTGLRIIYALAVVALALFVGKYVMSMFPIWLFGTALLWCKPPKVGSRTRWLVSIPFFLLICFLAKTKTFTGIYLNDYPMGLATAAWLWVQLSAKEIADPKSVPVRMSRWFSRLAFTMYAIHEPVLVMAAGLLLGDRRLTPTLPHFFGVLGVYLVVFGYIYLVARVTEFKTDNVRRWVDRVCGFDKHPRRTKHDVALAGDDRPASA